MREPQARLSHRHAALRADLAAEDNATGCLPLPLSALSSPLIGIGSQAGLCRPGAM